MVSFTNEQNSICSQKQLNDIAHEHTIICRQLFAGHMLGSRPMKRKKNICMIIIIIIIIIIILNLRTIKLSKNTTFISMEYIYKN